MQQTFLHNFTTFNNIQYQFFGIFSQKNVNFIFIKYENESIDLSFSLDSGHDLSI